MNEEVQEHLQVIRTLMERVALYRRALAPVFLASGALGLAGAAGGWFLRLADVRLFAGWWLGIAVVASILSVILVRRQAWQAREPFWTPPARRMAQAVLPALTAGLAVTWFLTQSGIPAGLAEASLVVAWHLSYGLALLTAGFFAPRGVRRLGMVFFGVALGMGLIEIGLGWMPEPRLQHGVMGATFGVVHLLAAAWLRVTEPANGL